MGFMVFKSTGSDSRFQRKNRFWKICTESQDITKKVSKIGLPNQTSKIWHILADISVLGAYFSKPIFALKPWVRASRFEYHEPHNPNNFFSLKNGSEPFCRPLNTVDKQYLLLFFIKFSSDIPPNLHESQSLIVAHTLQIVGHPSPRYFEIFQDSPRNFEIVWDRPR